MSDVTVSIVIFLLLAFFARILDSMNAHSILVAMLMFINNYRMRHWILCVMCTHAQRQKQIKVLFFVVN